MFPDRLRFRRDHRWAPAHMSEYLDGDLGERAVARLLRHVRECPECRALLHSLQSMIGLLGRRGVAPDDPVPDIADAVRRRLPG